MKHSLINVAPPELALVEAARLRAEGILNVPNPGEFGYRMAAFCCIIAASVRMEASMPKPGDLRHD